MRISDWSSDVCSSDLVGAVFPDGRVLREATRPEAAICRCHFEMAERNRHRKTIENFWKKGRKSAMSVNCKLIRQAREGASCARAGLPSLANRHDSIIVRVMAEMDDLPEPAGDGDWRRQRRAGMISIAGSALVAALLWFGLRWIAPTSLVWKRDRKSTRLNSSH